MQFRQEITCLLTLVLFLPSLLIAARDPNTEVFRGVVEDPNREPVPGAEVKLDNKTTHENFETTTNEVGEFTFTTLPGGDYILSVTAKGFEEVHVPVLVGTPSSHPIRLRLELSEIRDEVTVTGKLLSSPAAEQNIDVIELSQHWFRNLPVPNGDPLAVPSLFLDPAALGTGGPKIIVDGVESSALEVPTTSIKRVYVNKNPYSAEFGRLGKGRIEVTTRHGSYHHFRGDLSLLVHTGTLDARNAFAIVRPPLQRAVAEFDLDGPLGQKVALLLAGRYYLNNESAIINAETPTGNLVQNLRIPERNTFLFGRLDFKLKPTQTLTVGYQFKNRTRENQGVGEFNLSERATNLFHHKNEIKILDRAIFSSSLLNEVRFVLKEDTQETGGLSDRPAVIVLDAFSTGGAQVSQHKTERTADLQDLVALSKGAHTFRFGGGARPRFFRARDASNFGGTFTFSSLTAFTEGRPFLFTVNQGDPSVFFRQHEFFAFVQDEIQLRPNLSLSLGLRQELQSNLLNDSNNVAPRLAFAYSPGGRQTVLRVGVGVFYERQPEVMQIQRLLYDGFRIRQLVLSNPAFPLRFDPGATMNLAVPSVVRIAPDIRTPYVIQESLSIERKLGSGHYLTVEYATIRGVRLYRTRNVNAPIAGGEIRPDPNFINIDQFESSGSSGSRSLTVMFQSQLRHRLDLLLQYRLSRTTNDTGGLFSLPADNYDLRSERGPADFDRRHRFSLAAIYRLPLTVRLSGIVSLSSSLPFNITTGFDDNQDTVANDRPPGVGRNTGHGPGSANVDVRLSKKIRLQKESRRELEVGLDAFNVFNHVNFKNFIGTLSSPFFGRASAANQARQLQLSLRFRF